MVVPNLYCIDVVLIMTSSISVNSDIGIIKAGEEIMPNVFIRLIVGINMKTKIRSIPIIPIADLLKFKVFPIFKNHYIQQPNISTIPFFYPTHKKKHFVNRLTVKQGHKKSRALTRLLVSIVLSNYAFFSVLRYLNVLNTWRFKKRV